MITESSEDEQERVDPDRFEFVVTRSYVISAAVIRDALSVDGDDDDFDLSTEDLVCDAIKCQYNDLPEFLDECEFYPESWVVNLSKVEG